MAMIPLQSEELARSKRAKIYLWTVTILSALYIPKVLLEQHTLAMVGMVGALVPYIAGLVMIHRYDKV